jgi:multiple sugar transport system permease protein
MRTWRSALTHAGLAIGGLLMLFPFVWMLSLSLKDESEIYAPGLRLIPRTWDVANYVEAVTLGHVGTLFLNGVLVTVVILALQLVTIVPAAYVLAVKRFRLRHAIFAGVLGMLLIPPQVSAVPLYLLMSALGLVDTRIALVVPFATSAFGIFLVRQSIKTIPRDLLDAARMDGATDLDVLWSIVVPLCAPTLAAFSVLSIVTHWNDFFWPLVVIRSFDQATPPLGVSLFAADEGGTQVGAMMAAATLIVVPPMAAFLLARRWFFQGMTMSGIKG